MKKVSEEMLIKVLELLDKGESQERVLSTFPKEAVELRKYFKTISLLEMESEKIDPPSREILRSAIRFASAQHLIGFNRIPFALRLFAPALAVLFLVFFAGRYDAMAPGSMLVADKKAQDASFASGVTETVSPAPITFPSPESSPLQTASPIMAKSFMATEPNFPNSLAEGIAQAYIAGNLPVDFESLEKMMANMPDSKKNAFGEFKKKIEEAYAQKESSKITIQEFESEVNSALESFNSALSE